jgi:haloalkane dehalogenase
VGKGSDVESLRTPDDRFADLPDFDHPPNYADVADDEGGSLRMAYVETGPADGPVVLCLHGEPSWSFLYRRMIPTLSGAGLRVVAPDLIGFGRSDKPAKVEDHSYARHVEWVRALAFDRLDLREVTLVGHDWGGLIGLRLAAEHPDRFARLVATNTALPTGDQPMPDTWWRFRQAVEKAEKLDVGRVVQAGSRSRFDPDVLAAYNAPFPDESYKAGPRALPRLVPTEPDDPASGANRAAWAALSASQTPVLVAFSDSDPITAGVAPLLRRSLPGAQGRDHPVIAGAGHFVQEDAPDDLAREIVAFVDATG